VLSEERATRVSGPVPAYWIVDPIDGTGNLVAGLPFVGISVALVDAAGPRVAAVASLFDATTFSAIRGGGSWRGTTGVGDPAPMRLPDQPSDLVVLSTGVLDALAARPQDAAQRWPAIRAVGKIRNLGAQSLHLCGVAAGQFAAAASIEARVWDEAAGGLILREAGGHWRSAADGADWAVPAEMMSIAAQRSLACHPGCRIALDAALAGLITR
jgi:myo-inositol-1(or 4)-monophosphatase